MNYTEGLRPEQNRKTKQRS